MAKYIIGFLMIVVGFLLIWKTESIFRQVGQIAWAEAKFGGGTRFFIKLVGLIIILAAFLLMTGIIGKILLFIFVPGAQGEGGF